VVARGARAAGENADHRLSGRGIGFGFVWKDWTAAFAQRLRELGWVEGRTLVIEYRWGEGRAERYADLAAEFVALKVDVIVTSGSAAVAVKWATSAIPIVFATANEPIGSATRRQCDWDVHAADRSCRQAP
jgi:hypothetical protein